MRVERCFLSRLSDAWLTYALQNTTGRLFMMLCWLMVLVCMFSATATAQDLELEITSPAPELQDQDSGQVVRMRGYGSVTVPGAPELPVRGYQVLLPPDTDLNTVNIRVLRVEQREVPGTFDIAPAPPMLAVDSKSQVYWGDSKSIRDGRDMGIYGVNALFPASVIEIDSVGRYRQWKLVRIRFTPVQYNPVTKRLYHTMHVVFSVDFQQKSPAEPVVSSAHDTLSQLFGNTLLNPEAQSEWYGSGLVSKSLSGHGYAIITTDAVKDALYTPGTATEPAGMLYRFASHKSDRGFRVFIITETSCISHPDGVAGPGYGTEQGQQRAINIRNWLMDHYGTTEKDIKYVLLIGNPDPQDPYSNDPTYGDLPMMMCQPKADLTVPTDYFFAELTGNWDLDGDGRYCEFSGDMGTGGVEFVPEVYVGRIPFSDTAKISAVLAKIVSYEDVSYSASDNSNLVWRKRVLLPMTVLNFGMSAWASCYPSDGYRVTDEAFLGRSLEENVFFHNGFSTLFMTEKQGGSPSPIDGDMALPTDYNGLSAYWNQDRYYGMVFWSAHGSKTAIYRKYLPADRDCPISNNLFYISQPDTDIDSTHPAFVISSSCNIGYPENPDSLSFELLQGGAVGVLASSRTSWYYEGNFAAGPEFVPKSIESEDIRATCYYFAKDFTANIPAGDALFHAKAAKDLSKAMAWTNNFVANLYGDPSLTILPFATDGPDSDGDGISDSEELYVYKSDPNSQDTDGDGVSDKDELYYMTGDWMLDQDGDGLNALHDPDSDGDGVSDFVEINVFHTRPALADSDHDGLGDYDEVNRDGNPGDYTQGVDSDPNDPDTDQDGVLDGADPNPVDPSDNRPVANAGPDQFLPAQEDGTVVSLDGSGSMDPNGDTLLYSWRIMNSVSEAPGAISPNYATSAVSAQFVAKVAADYVVQLKVRDENVWSEPDQVIIHIRPVILSVEPVSVQWGDTVTIHGFGFDKDASENSVTVDGKVAEITSAAYDTLQITIPSGCLNGRVVVTVNGVCSDPVHLQIELPPGTFVQAPAGSIPEIETCSRSVAMGDVDGDGDLDIAVANMGGLPQDEMDYDDPACSLRDPQNRLYLNDGTGVFTDMTFGEDGQPMTSDDRLPVDTDQTTDIKLVDIDGDGDLDMVTAVLGRYRQWETDTDMDYREECAGQGGQNRILINDGHGHFVDETAVRLPALMDPTVKIAIGDFNGDHSPDIVFGNFKECAPAQDRWPQNDECCMYCADCSDANCMDDPWLPCCTGECDYCQCCEDCSQCPDNPGCQDYYAPTPSKDRFYINDGTGHFTDVTSEVCSTCGQGETWALTLDDMDGDGDMDLLRYDTWYHYLYVYRNAEGVFIPDFMYSMATAGAILTSDLNRDPEGLSDIFAIAVDEYPSYMVQEDSGFVDHSVGAQDSWLPPDMEWSDVENAEIGILLDADVDGDMDVAIGTTGSRPNTLFLNDDNEPGHFILWHGMPSDLETDTHGMASGDVNNDGSPDLFLANYGQNILLLNTTRVSSEFDLDHDGDVDGADLYSAIRQSMLSGPEKVKGFAALFGHTGL